MIKAVDLSNDILSAVLWCWDYYHFNGLVSWYMCPVCVCVHTSVNML